MDTTTHSFKTLRQFNCTGCGSALTIVNQRSKYVGCPHCGAVLDAKSNEYTVITRQKTKFPPMSFLSLGMKGNLDGKEYRIIARTRWKSRYKEYWEEEGEKGYSDEFWSYDSWLLISENRTYRYLVEDQEGFMLSDSIIPLNPCIPQDTHMNLFDSRFPQVIREYGTAEVVYFEGESTYQVNQGDAVKFWEYGSKDRVYATEVRLDKHNNYKEVDFFMETPIPREEVAKHFNSPEEFERLYEPVYRLRFVRNLAMVAAVALLIFWLIAPDESTRKPIFSVCKDIERQDTIKLKTDFWQMNSDQPMCELHLQASLAQEDALFPSGDVAIGAWVGVGIFDAQNNLVNTFQGDFFYESGRDDEGAWTDSHLEEREFFKVNASGQYYARIYIIRDTRSTGQVCFSVNQSEGARGRYFGWGGFVFLLIAGTAQFMLSLRKWMGAAVR